MDPLVEALQQTTAQKPGFRCGVQKLRASMSAEQQAAFDIELDGLFEARQTHTRYRHSAESLARVLSDHGFTIRGAVIQGHLAGRCACGR
jgi:hypothetical protein